MFNWYPILSRLFGSILVMAGVIKLQDTISSGLIWSSLSWNWESLARFQGIVEIAFGWWIVCGFRPLLTWWLQLFCLVGFFSYSFDKIQMGETSCGCLGSIDLDPRISFGFNVIMWLALLLSPPPVITDQKAKAGIRWLTYTVGFAASILVSFLASTSRLSIEDEEQWATIAKGQTIQLQPQAWIEKRFPLSRQIPELGSQLLRGNWIVFLHRSACPPCQKELPFFVANAKQLAQQTQQVRLAMIHIPSQNQSEEILKSKIDGDCPRSYLNPDFSWHVQTPVFLRIEDGIVKQTAETSRALLKVYFPSESEEKTETILCPDFRQIRREMFLRQIACGPLSLMAILQEFQIPISEEKSEYMIDQAGRKGIDLYKLKQLTEEFNLHTLGVEVTPNKLREMGQKAIVLLNGVGFAAVTRYTSDGFVVTQPLEEKGILPDEVFQKAFGEQGIALLVSTKPLEPQRYGLDTADMAIPDGPRLRLEKNMLPIGWIHSYSWEGSMQLTNEGTKEIEITDVSINCGCAKATVGQKHLKPGESTTLYASGKQPVLKGFLYRIRIKTNDRDQTLISIPVSGYVDHPIGFSKPWIRVTRLLPNESTCCEVELDLVKGINNNQLILNVPKKLPIETELVQKEQKSLLRITWKGSSEVKAHSGVIGIRMSQSEDAIESQLPIQFEVVPAIAAFPQKLNLSQKEWKSGWKRTIRVETCKPIQEGEWTLTWNTKAPKTIQSKLRKVDSLQWEIELEASGNASYPDSNLEVKLATLSNHLTIPIEIVRNPES